MGKMRKMRETKGINVREKKYKTNSFHRPYTLNDHYAFLALRLT